MIEKVKISDVPELTEVKENAFVFVIDGTEPLAADRTKRIQLTNIVAPIAPSALPYKVYTAIIKLNGANDPVPVVLQNTIGDIVWTRQDVGYYTANGDALFPLDKTFTLINVQSPETSEFVRVDSDNIELIMYGGAGTQADGFTPAQVEIRVYN
jgi:hypothetical protein